MAILQDVDKCIRCNGCVISCKRTWNMKALNPGVHKVAADQRVIIKSQNRIDNGPFLRFSCWHCPDPPCVKRCPFKAIVRQGDTSSTPGAVSVDPTLCNPGGTNSAGITCTRQCVVDCQRGGYPKVGVGSNNYATEDAWKCTLCYGRSGALEDPRLTQAQRDELKAKYGNPLPSKSTAAEITAVPEKAHWPACVFTCPAKAMTWDTRANIIAQLKLPANGYKYWIGDGSMFWASKKLTSFLAPKADPFIEDHVTPMLTGAFSSSSAKLPLVPTIVAGGLFAVIARRQMNASGQGEG